MSGRSIAFGVLCAREPADSVRQLVTALGTDHEIFVHHDFRKSQKFTSENPRARFIPDPVETGWGTWGLVQAVLKTMQHALEHSRFDYFQLLSGSCLPIRPIAEFERHISHSTTDANIGLISLFDSDDAMMTYGWRVFASNPSLRRSLLLRARLWYFAGDTTIEQRSGVDVVHRSPSDSPWVSFARSAGLRVTNLARRGVMFSHPFSDSMKPYVGSGWFGCTREVCEYIVKRPETEVLETFYRTATIADESYFHTLLGNSKFRVAPPNHFINDFNGPHPRVIEANDLPRMRKSDAFFARKFNPDINDPSRAAALELCAEKAMDGMRNHSV